MADVAFASVIHFDSCRNSEANLAICDVPMRLPYGVGPTQRADLAAKCCISRAILHLEGAFSRQNGALRNACDAAHGRPHKQASKKTYGRLRSQLRLNAVGVAGTQRRLIATGMRRRPNWPRYSSNAPAIGVAQCGHTPPEETSYDLMSYQSRTISVAWHDGQ